MPESTDKFAKPTILVVDDTPDNLTLLSGLLKDQYKVKVAGSGEKALRIADSETPPDLVLLDIMMPVMDGYDVLAQLQSKPATQSIPVIFITALSDMESEIRGLSGGAVDYITKPFNPPVVLARVATHLALRKARAELEIRNSELANERTMVENIIIRMRTHQQFDERNLRYLISPVERCNGDILLSACTPDGRQWVLVGDFTGHGLPAAVAAPLVTQVFYSSAAASADCRATLATLNNVLYTQLPAEMFMVACFVEISAARDRLYLWCAGIPTCLLFGASGEEKRLPSTGTLPFGIIPDLDIAAACVALDVAENDRLYVYTDGISETENPAGEMFGAKRLAALVAPLGLQGSLDEVLAELEKFHGGNDFHDDITLVEIRL